MDRKVYRYKTALIQECFQVYSLEFNYSPDFALLP